MAEALIYIGDAATNTWRDGDVITVRLQDGTFSPLEHRFPFAVIPLGAAVTRQQALEWEKSGQVLDTKGNPTPETAGRRRVYRIDWKSLIASRDGTVGGRDATEQDVLNRDTVTWSEKDATVVEVRSEGVVVTP